MKASKLTFDKIRMQNAKISKICYLIVLVIISTVLSGCASLTELTVADESWTFEERAVSIEISSPADLNARSGRPHAIIVGIYQLNDPNTFGALSQEKSGAIQLLRTGKLDDTIVDFRRLTVQPGERLTQVFARAEGAKYVGVISGYFDLNVKQDTHLFKIPCIASGRGVVEKILSGMALIADEAKAQPDKIAINIKLGRSSVKKYETTNESSLSSVCI